MQNTLTTVRSLLACVHPARAQLARILDSSAFAKSKRHREFLTYLVEQELAYPGAQSKETLIAIEVFERDLRRFDTRLDPIVRIEAGRLRKRLQQYYANAGCDDAIRFDMPKGSYSLGFRFCQRVPAVTMRETTALVGRVDSGTRSLGCANDCREYPLAAD